MQMRKLRPGPEWLLWGHSTQAAQPPAQGQARPGQPALWGGIREKLKTWSLERQAGLFTQGVLAKWGDEASD